MSNYYNVQDAPNCRILWCCHLITTVTCVLKRDKVNGSERSNPTVTEVRIKGFQCEAIDAKNGEAKSIANHRRNKISPSRDIFEKCAVAVGTEMGSMGIRRETIDSSTELIAKELDGPRNKPKFLLWTK